MSVKILKTQYRQAKEAKELIIYKERQKLLMNVGAMKTVIDLHLCKKYKIASKATIWLICKRVEKRLKEEQMSSI